MIKGLFRTQLASPRLGWPGLAKNKYKIYFSRGRAKGRQQTVRATALQASYPIPMEFTDHLTFKEATTVG